MTSHNNLVLKKFKETKRNHPYLAFTLNSICDLDCVFCKPRCMPNYGVKDNTLTVIDYRAIAQEAARWGIKKAHMSGGEPTLRRDILDIIYALRSELGNKDTQIGITTHANLRKGLTVKQLQEAGLTSINISLHSLDTEKSRNIMGGGNSNTVLDNIENALELGLQVKINCVVQRTSLDDAREVMFLARRLPIAVRLIELQRIGPAEHIFQDEYVTEQEFKYLNTDVFSNVMEKNRAYFKVRSPGRYVQPHNWLGHVSFISNSSCATCSDANRIKITPTGHARPCILSNRDIDLKEYIQQAQLDRAFSHLFESIIDRNNNPDWNGYHYIDYDLRWDRTQDLNKIDIKSIV